VEYDAQNHIVKSVELSADNFSVIYSNGTNSVQTWQYTSELSSGARIVVTMAFYGVFSQLSFANESLTLAPHSVKLTIEVDYWPFASVYNTLGIQILAEYGQQQATQCYQISEDSGQNVLWFRILGADGFSLYATFVQSVLVDNIRKYYGKFRWIDVGLVELVVPHFWENVICDPLFSLLVDNTDTQNLQCSSTESSSTFPLWKFSLIIVGGVAGLSVLTIVIVKLYPLYHTWKRFKMTTTTPEK